MFTIDLKKYQLAFILALVASMLLTGCYKFEGAVETPAYISISDIDLDTYFPEEGTNSQEITDVWVYLDDGLLGVYEFPSTDSIPLIFPVLASGKHKLEIRPGIKLNGISSTRVPYPFYKPIIYNDLDFVPGTTKALGVISTTYYSDVNFVWLEDFEQSNISIEDFGDTIIEQTQPEDNPIAFLSSTSRYSGIVNLTQERKEYTGISFNSFEMQKAGTIVMLEMNFKTNSFFQVGLLIRDKYGPVEKDLVILKSTDDWKKIYINLGSNLSLYPTAYDYKVIFRGGLDSGDSNASILIDNIKVVYR